MLPNSYYLLSDLKGQLDYPSRHGAWFLKFELTGLKSSEKPGCIDIAIAIVLTHKMLPKFLVSTPAGRELSGKGPSFFLL
jgi:hypothetical protein